jgi:hypothetical protein
MPDRLTDRFTELAENLGRAARPATVDQIRHRGDARRRSQTILAALGSGVVLVAVGLLVSRPAGSVGLGPGNPFSPPRPRPTAIAADLRMPHEGQAGWTRSDDPHAPGAIPGCGGTDPTLAGRIDAVTTHGRGLPIEEQHSPTVLTEQVLLFTDATAARTALLAIEATLHGCGYGGGMIHWMNFGFDTVLGRWPANLSGQLTLLKDAAATLRGNALVVGYDEVRGSFMSTGFTQDIPAINDAVCATMGLCEPPICWIGEPSPLEPSPTPCPSSPSPSGPPSPTGPYGSPGSPAPTYSPPPGTPQPEPSTPPWPTPSPGPTVTAIPTPSAGPTTTPGPTPSAPTPMPS